MFKTPCYLISICISFSVMASELEELATTRDACSIKSSFPSSAPAPSLHSPIPIIAAVTCSTTRKPMKTSTPCVLASAATRSLSVRSRWITARSAAITREAVRYGDDCRADQRI